MVRRVANMIAISRRKHDRCSRYIIHFHYRSHIKQPIRQIRIYIGNLQKYNIGLKRKSA